MAKSSVMHALNNPPQLQDMLCVAVASSLSCHLWVSNSLAGLKNGEHDLSCGAARQQLTAQSAELQAPGVADGSILHAKPGSNQDCGTLVLQLCSRGGTVSNTCLFVAAVMTG